VGVESTPQIFGEMDRGKKEIQKRELPVPGRSKFRTCKKKGVGQEREKFTEKTEKKVLEKKIKKKKKKKKKKKNKKL
jgi:hypothetical protein